MIKNQVLLNRIYLVSKCRALPLAAATQYFWLAESNIGLLPLASSFCLVVYAIDKPIKKEHDNGK